MHAGEIAQAGWQWWRLTRQQPDDAEAWAGLVVCGQATERGAFADRAHRALYAAADEPTRQQELARQWQRLAATPAGRQKPAMGTSPLTELLQRSAAVLQDAAEHNPGRADVHFHHAASLAGLGSRARANVAVDRALAINPHYRQAKALKRELAA
jgi:Flp pilus assembly protein TadD